MNLVNTQNINVELYLHHMASDSDQMKQSAQPASHSFELDRVVYSMLKADNSILTTK